jgi:hypothetical protein
MQDKEEKGRFPREKEITCMCITPSKEKIKKL